MGEQLHKEGKENGDKVVKDMEAVAKFNPLIHHSYKTNRKAHAPIDNPETWS